MTRWWLTLVVVLLGGMLFAAMFTCLRESIEAAAALGMSGYFNSGRGIVMLFSIASGVVGWVSVSASERSLGISGWPVFLVAAPAFTVALAGGVVVAAISYGALSRAMLQMAGLTWVVAAIAASIRTALEDAF